MFPAKKISLMPAANAYASLCSPTGRFPTGRSGRFDHLKVALSVGVQTNGAFR
jgi:hypothetical protein